MPLNITLTIKEFKNGGLRKGKETYTVKYIPILGWVWVYMSTLHSIIEMYILHIYIKPLEVYCTLIISDKVYCGAIIYFLFFNSKSMFKILMININLWIDYCQSCRYRKLINTWRPIRRWNNNKKASNCHRVWSWYRWVSGLQ